MIYLDNGATTKIRKEVREAMLPYLDTIYGNPSSVYEIGRQARKAVEDARAKVADAINAQYPREIFFTGCGTESDNWAIWGAALARQDKGRHLITSQTEHHAVLHQFKIMEKLGFETTYVAPDDLGRITSEAVKEAIRPDTILISVMMANNEVGTINPVSEIGSLARSKGILFHTDAVQAAGHIPIDVQAMNIDMLSMSAHKFNGPKGVGALYIKNGIKIENFMNGGAQERKRRGGTENVASIVGMGEAIKLAVEEMESEAERLTLLRAMMIGMVTDEIDGVTLNGDPVNRIPGNVNLLFQDIESEAALIKLDMAGIACSGGSACTSGSIEPSHVLTAMGIPPKKAKGAIRFTLGRYNTPGQVAKTVKILKDIVEKLR